MPEHEPRSLTPEEESVADPEDVEEEIDDTLPADLWFRSAGRGAGRVGRPPVVGGLIPPA